MTGETYPTGDGSLGLHPAPAGRGRRRDHAVELPPEHPLAQARARRWPPGNARHVQAQRGHPPDGPAPRRGAPPGGRPRRGPRAGARARRGRPRHGRQRRRAGRHLHRSTEVGTAIHEVTGVDVRTQLEMGGKNALVVLEDPTSTGPTAIIAKGAFGLSGQAWHGHLAGDRPRGRGRRARRPDRRGAPRPHGSATASTTASPSAPSPTRRRRQVLPLRRGAAGQGRPPRRADRPQDRPALAGGHFVRPTIFRDVDPLSAMAQEEIFSPVLAVHHRPRPTRRRSARGERHALRPLGGDRHLRHRSGHPLLRGRRDGSGQGQPGDERHGDERPFRGNEALVERRPSRSRPAPR